MRLRLRLSLLARMTFALGVLLSITLVIAALLSLVGGMLGVALLGGLYSVAETLAGLPRLSTVAPVPPLLVAGAAGLGVFAAIQCWPHVRARTDEAYLLPPTTPISVVVTLAILGCLYLVVVEAGGALLAGLSTAVGVAVIVGLGVALAFAVTVGEVRRRVADLRSQVVAGDAAIVDATPGVEATTRRLAQQADVPPPDVHVVGTERPESLTVGSGEDAVVVVSSGLLETLTAAELEAVLAHEVSHLANGDSRVLGAALAPVLVADDWIDEDPGRLGEYAWTGLFALLKLTRSSASPSSRAGGSGVPTPARPN